MPNQTNPNSAPESSFGAKATRVVREFDTGPRVPLPRALQERINTIDGPAEITLGQGKILVVPVRLISSGFRFEIAPLKNGTWSVVYRPGSLAKIPSSIRKVTAGLEREFDRIAAEPWLASLHVFLRAELESRPADEAGDWAQVAQLRALSTTEQVASDAEALLSFASGDAFRGLAWVAQNPGAARVLHIITQVVAGRRDVRSALSAEMSTEPGFETNQAREMSEPRLRTAFLALQAIGAPRNASVVARALATRLTKNKGADLHLRTAKDAAERVAKREAWQATVAALRLAPNSVGVVARAARIFGQLGEPDEEAVLNERAWRLDPDQKQSLIGRCTLSLRRGDYSEAVRLAKELTRRFPDGLDGHRSEGAALVMTGQFEAARAALGRVFEVDPTDPEAVLWLARLELAEGNPDAAKDVVDTRALRVTSPANGLIRIIAEIDSGRAFDELRLVDGYGGVLSEVLTSWLSPERVAVACETPESLRELCYEALDDLRGVYVEPLTRFVPESDGAPAHLEALVVPARSRTESSNALKSLRSAPLEDVLTRLTALKEQFPASPHPSCYRGELYVWMGEFDRAAADFHDGLQARPARWGFVGLAAIAALRGDLERALEFIAECNAKLRPIPGATTHVYLGEIYRTQGRFELAREHLEEALRAKPSRHAARSNLALAMLHQSDTAGAAREVDRLWGAIPGLLWAAADDAGVPIVDRRSTSAIEPILVSALKLMRGNRSSHLVTYFVGDEMRVVPSRKAWQTLAVESNETLQEFLIHELATR